MDSRQKEKKKTLSRLIVECLDELCISFLFFLSRFIWLESDSYVDVLLRVNIFGHDELNLHAHFCRNLFLEEEGMQLRKNGP